MQRHHIILDSTGQPVEDFTIQLNKPVDNVRRIYLNRFISYQTSGNPNAVAINWVIEGFGLEARPNFVVSNTNNPAPNLVTSLLDNYPALLLLQTFDAVTRISKIRVRGFFPDGRAISAHIVGPVMLHFVVETD